MLNTRALFSPQMGRAFQWVVFCVYLAFQVSLTAFPILSRQAPLEPDDAYSLIIKSAEIKDECFLQDCPALVDLREQFQSPTEDISSAAIRHRQYHRVFEIYQPLHSFILLGINSLGFSFESAHDLFAIVGKLFLTLVIAYWLFAVWGAPTAAIALLLLTPVVFPGQGLHYTVPSSVTLGLGFLLWAEILRKTDRVKWMFIPILVCMLLLHTVGKVYGLMATFLFLFQNGWPPTKRTWILVGISLSLIVISFSLPALITQPEFGFNPTDFYPGAWDYFAAFQASLPLSRAVVDLWLSRLGGISIALFLILIGIFAVPADKRTPVLKMGGLVIAVLAASLFYLVPWYGAVTFIRIWILAAIFLTGAIANGIFQILAFIFDQFQTFLKRPRRKTAKTRKGAYFPAEAQNGLASCFS